MSVHADKSSSHGKRERTRLRVTGVERDTLAIAPCCGIHGPHVGVVMAIHVCTDGVSGMANGCLSRMGQSLELSENDFCHPAMTLTVHDHDLGASGGSP